MLTGRGCAARLTRMIPILILAAGASNRMNGRDKLLMEVGGQTMLRHVVGRAVDTNHPVMVALPAGDTARRDALAGLDVQIISVVDHDRGMAGSLRAGLAMMPARCDGMLIGLADMPDITKDDYLSIINAFSGNANANIYRGSSHGSTAGNPVLLPKWALNDPSVFKGDAGARHLLEKHSDRVRLVPLPGDHAITDLDTPADWAAWRARP